MLKNITLSANKEHIERAREVASYENTTLNQAFRDWLEHYQAKTGEANKYLEVMKKLSKIDSGKKKFSREELNER